MKSKYDKRREADERQEAREARGDQGQLQRLVDNGHSHCREAVKLRKELGIDE